MGARIDLSDVTVFVRLVETGSFRAAARVLGLPVSTVSRRISALEAGIGARLVERTTRAVAITDLGRQYFARCQRILASAHEAVEALRAPGEAPAGLVRLTAPVPLGVAFVGDVVSDMLVRHPGVAVDAQLTDRMVDLVEEGFDVAIRVQRSAAPAPELVSRQLGWTRVLLVASPGYLNTNSVPRAPGDLARHAGIVYGHPLFEGGASLRGPDGEVIPELPERMRVNDMALALRAAAAGAGIAAVSVLIAGPEIAAGTVVRVLPEWEAPAAPVLAVYPARRGERPAVKALLEVLEERLSPSLRAIG